MEYASSADFEPDRQVLGANGQTLGVIDKIIYEPFREEVLAIVVSSGRLKPRRTIVHRQHVVGSAPLAIRTNLAPGQLEGLTRFREVDFRRPPGSWAPPRDWSPGRVRWPGPDPLYPVSAPDVARSEAPTIAVSADVPDTCCPAGSVEREWREQHDLRFQVDPVDVLHGPGPTCCRTPYEWG